MMYVYLHGFASSPRSWKAQFAKSRWQKYHQPLITPDLNQNDFSHLTLSRQIHQVQTLIADAPAVTLIGSSFGGLTAAWLGERFANVQRLVLLAPAFYFLENWLPTIEPAALHKWQAGEPMMVDHHGEGQKLPLHYQFIQDLEQYSESHLQKSLPTLIIHGQGDQIIPIQSSYQYSQNRPWVTVESVDDDHALTEIPEAIWQKIEQFCGLQS
ncbi:YqiA/YcfP family alpha/beta fold hydrolase [Alkalinema sp. FACHB-956]|uniref:YqiA/YcfP family alpha/beta fold hydrolase n=1 Tax=Alkalinema sp. FACHB-956 TaxID=2692768 RepID=UPI00168466E0|nr:YqiA/YcfP family alpha/beta fold hydrolase [Alkalinema sp. FACHB-956]MBD2328937.1 alpha/beta fold hydrolase [Alkalinema sp. FACHB-956]